MSHHLFVYGTLKPGFPNEHSLPDGVKFLGPCVTVNRFPLVVEPRTKVPFLLFSDDQAKNVRGVLCSVSNAALHELDAFEGVGNGFYERRTLEVKLAEHTTPITAFAYFRHVCGLGPSWAREWSLSKLRALPWLEEYTLEDASGFLKRDTR